MKHHQFHVIKDPVHGVMQFSHQEDQWIKPFINHPYLQRLRHIKQNGLADAVFPGAVYSRFNHALGCCYVGSQIANKIGLIDEEKQLVIIACLLHDIGHGPFSHAFEDLFTHKCIRHEEWTPYFLRTFTSEAFLTTYNTLNPDFPLSADKMLCIQKMIMHEYTDNKLLSDIVSSQIDADRFDYLLRDSHFCGVKYGEFDLRWMLHCLTFVETDGGLRLGVTHKGVGAVEHYLMARCLMIRNIYHHKKKQAVEYLLIQFMTKLAEHMPTTDFLAQYRDSPLGQLLVNANVFNHHIRENKPTRAEISTFLEKNFHLYERLCDYHVLVMIQELAQLTIEHDIIKLAQRIFHRHMPALITLPAEHIEAVRILVESYKKAQAEYLSTWQVAIINTPQSFYNEHHDPIWVVGSRGDKQKISDLSHIIRALSDRHEPSCVLLMDKELALTIHGHQFLDEIRELLSSNR